jgi:hypothetical protein
MRGDHAIRWIQEYCVMPSGKRVVLSPDDRNLVHAIYDGLKDIPVSGALAAYLTLLHLAGPEAKQNDFRPNIAPVDLWTLWAAVGPGLRPFLVRKGGSVHCPELGTTYSVAA